jgi:hypothetical protein
MAQPGRKSAASLSVVGLVTSLKRLAPPDDLTSEQRSIWLATVNSKPAEWFGDEHMPILREYVRHVVTAEVLTRQIEGFDPAWMADDEGLKRYDKLTGMRAREAGVINTLARSMRLTQQAAYRADKAATLGDKSRGRKPWQQLEE